jgi:hypothetical protein
MVKVPPEERWRSHILERFVALRHSGELDRLSKKGLTILGRKKRFTGKQWFKSFSKRVSCPSYREWYDECEAVAARFGLAPGTVVCACLVSRYDPKKELSVIEGHWPKIRIITENTNSLFSQWLSYEAQRLGLYVVQRQGSVETTLLNIDSPPFSALSTSQKPPRDNAFYLRIETPPGYPPEAAQKLQKKADQLMKELLRRLGYPVPSRLRTSKLIDHADDLQLEKFPLSSRGLYEIVAEKWKKGSVSEDEERRKLMKSRRHKGRQRLIKPYESDI